MKRPALINAITYQALHSAIARLGANQDEEEEDEAAVTRLRQEVREIGSVVLKQRKDR